MEVTAAGGKKIKTSSELMLAQELKGKWRFINKVIFSFS
jgi:hypothetical protein